MMSADAFELVNANWTEHIQRWEIGELEKVEKLVNGLAVRVTLKRGNPSVFELMTMPDPCDNLLSAMQAEPVQTQKKVLYLGVPSILPSLRFQDRPLYDQLQRMLIVRSRDLLQTYSLKNKDRGVSSGLVDLLTASFRLRFTNEFATDVSQSVTILETAFQREMMVAWCRGVVRLMNKVEAYGDPRGETWAIGLTTAITKTIEKLCTALALGGADLVRARDVFVTSRGEGGSRAALKAVAERLGQQAKEAFDRDLKMTPAWDEERFRHVIGMTVVLFGGVQAKVYQETSDKMTGVVVDVVRSMISKASVVGNPRDTLNAARNEFCTELLMFLDGRRYDDIYQFLFCVYDAGLVASGIRI